jgi:hypothetical protein
LQQHYRKITIAPRALVLGKIKSNPPINSTVPTNGMSQVISQKLQTISFVQGSIF